MRALWVIVLFLLCGPIAVAGADERDAAQSAFKALGNAPVPDKLPPGFAVTKHNVLAAADAQGMPDGLREGLVGAVLVSLKGPGVENGIMYLVYESGATAAKMLEKLPGIMFADKKRFDLLGRSNMPSDLLASPGDCFAVLEGGRYLSTHCGSADGPVLVLGGGGQPLKAGAAAGADALHDRAGNLLLAGVAHWYQVDPSTTPAAAAHKTAAQGVDKLWSQ